MVTVVCLAMSCVPRKSLAAFATETLEALWVL